MKWSPENCTLLYSQAIMVLLMVAWKSGKKCWCYSIQQSLYWGKLTQFLRYEYACSKYVTCGTNMTLFISQTFPTNTLHTIQMSNLCETLNFSACHKKVYGHDKLWQGCWTQGQNYWQKGQHPKLLKSNCILDTARFGKWRGELMIRHSWVPWLTSWLEATCSTKLKVAMGSCLAVGRAGKHGMVLLWYAGDQSW